MKKLPHPLSHRLRTRVATATALLAALAATPAAQASLVITYVETDGNVVATGSGSFDSSDLQQIGSIPTRAGVSTARGIAIVGLDNVADFFYSATNFNGPTRFGAGPRVYADSGSGDLFGVMALDQWIFLPQGYTSGNALSGTATFSNASFASLEMDPGTYVWTFGSGEHADSITVQVGPTTQANVPEPASLALAGLGLAGLAASRRRKQG